MAYRTDTVIETDVLIVGSGIAGLLLAHELQAKKVRTVLACKGRLNDSNTALAQGGLAAVTTGSAFDSPELHLADTVAAGAGLTDARVARAIIEQGGELVERLEELGVRFDRATPYKSNPGSDRVNRPASSSEQLHPVDSGGLSFAEGRSVDRPSLDHANVCLPEKAPDGSSFEGRSVDRPSSDPANVCLPGKAPDGSSFEGRSVDRPSFDPANVCSPEEAPDGSSFELAREGGHSRARVLHSKDASGRAIVHGLIEALHQAEKVTVIEDAFALYLLGSESGCDGAVLLAKGEALPVRAQATVLATGGIGQLYSRTTNPKVATGDGIAMAYRLGARLVDLEFVQFHPTALALPDAPALLVSEAVRGAGAHLIDQNGDRFAFRFHSQAELATRDIVARAMHSVMIEQDIDCVWLDMRPIGAREMETKFPNILHSCRRWGLDPAVQAIPVAPAAHYFMGGIAADEAGCTSVPRLYAIGECASTGLHGANRLASNSLLEGGIMALNAARRIAGQEWRATRTSSTTGSSTCKLAAEFIPQDLDLLKRSMFRQVGLQRCENDLQQFLDQLSANLNVALIPRNRAAAEAANMALLASLIARAALARQESRGAHWRSDFPSTSSAFERRYCISVHESGWLPAQHTHAMSVGLAGAVR